MRINLLHAALGAALCAMLVQPAQAQHRDRDFHRHNFYGRDFHHFAPRERQVWQGGRWTHGWHDNRFAWWWITGGGWYQYPAPVYPYPTYVPPAVIVQSPVPGGLPPAQFWYYCASPPGYYPYVPTCSVPWRQVPAR